MPKNLVIVESPAKAKTISQFLGKDYVVKASMGHVRDLPKSKMGIDVENNFEPSYGISLDKTKVIKDLKASLKSASTLWIATDEDREGEAIGWHLLKALNVKEKDDKVKRIVFHEITKPAILKAIETPRVIDQNLVDAQQARRVLDRLVGYELSPLLWKKIRFGLSAGRVQSVAVRLIVEREEEIDKFKAEEYWHIDALFNKQKPKKDESLTEFEAQLFKKDKDKIEIKNKEQSDKILDELDGSEYKISKVEQKEAKRSPAPPFTTSTLQQEAARKLGFSVKKTMTLAQQLYEGIKTDKEHSGLITYMRTDSVNLSDTALKQAKNLIETDFGKEYALASPRRFKSKKGAQEAHEAIRPVDLSLSPEKIKKFLDKDQSRLYELIWKRTIACQMQEALFDKVSVDIKASKGNYIFRATGQTVKFMGFIKVYKESFDNAEDEQNDMDKILPKLEEGESVDLKKLVPSQHFTKPPARYTEASLVKKLEAEGIGRPSTYAPTISTIIARGYIEKDNKQLVPTDTAKVVNKMLVEHFPNIVDIGFTAEMEEDLDKIAEGKQEWVPIIKIFYDDFHKVIEEKEKTIKKDDIVNEQSDEKCDKCGKPMVIKLGRYGKFLSCSDYPKCKNAKPLKSDEPQEKTQAQKDLEQKLSDKKCDKCGKPMVIKTGKYGEFLGCSDYPTCKNIQSIIKLAGVHCPECKTGQLIEKRTRKGGKVFYGCNKYPKCKFATWDTPLKKPCPKCKGLLVEKTNKEGKKEKCTKCEYEK